MLTTSLTLGVVGPNKLNLVLTHMPENPKNIHNKENQITKYDQVEKSRESQPIGSYSASTTGTVRQKQINKQRANVAELINL